MKNVGFVCLCLVQVLSLARSQVAHAEASVNARVVDAAGLPADGRVILKNAQQTLSCVTVASRCALRARGGKYEASVVPRRDKAPPVKTVSLPSSGTVNVVFTLLKADAAPAPKSAATSQPTTSEHDAVRRNPPGRNLAQGKKETMTGRVVDGAGLPADALVVLTASGKTTPVGHVVSVSGRFAVRDLSAGSYTAKVYSRRGGPPTTQPFRVTSRVGQVVIKVK